MKDSLKNFVIPFTGLKDGTHLLTFEVGKEFFDQFEYSLIESGDVLVEMELEKRVTMLTTRYNISGKINTTCDRCNDPVTIEIEGDYRIIFKFGTEESDNEELIILPNEAYELHLANYIYEFITLCLPLKKLHPKGECNEQMLRYLNENSVFLLDDDDDEEEYEDDEDEDWLEE